ncbi:MAG TPA: GAF domain-containing SpoIIE family protein phosphatase [Tepidisphaeraceae bacterium]|jgi:phosphoserine phosphatase
MEASFPISAAQMKRVLDVTRLLTVTADLDLLLRRMAESACEILNCERASIFLYDAKADQLWTKVVLGAKEIRVPSGAGIVGAAFQANKLLHVPEPYKDSRFNPEPDRRNNFVTRNLLTCPMVDIEGKAVGVVQAVNKKDGLFMPGDEAMIQLLADQAGVAIQRFHLQQAAIEAVSLRREMDLAKEVQEALIPQEPPRVEGIDAAGWTRTASITGGDCYDLWKTSDGRLGIFVGDATGHGIGPALVVSQARTLIRAMCDMKSDPVELLACANARLNDDLETGNFVTAFVGFLSPDGTLDWCSAGHGPILIRSSENGSIESFDATAPPLGVLPQLMADRVKTMRLSEGGMICVNSDGINEAFSPAGQQFGAERLIEILSDGGSHTASDQIIARVQAAVSQWQGGDEPKDDQTMVIASYRPTNGKTNGRGK